MSEDAFLNEIVSLVFIVDIVDYKYTLLKCYTMNNWEHMLYSIEGKEELKPVPIKIRMIKVNN